MEKQLIEVAVTDNLGNDLGTTMWRPSHPDPKKPYVGADACFLCGRTYSRDQFQYYRGTPFGVPCGHSKDIPWYRERDVRQREGREG